MVRLVLGLNTNVFATSTALASGLASEQRKSRFALGDGLPLGILPGAEFTQTHVRLVPNDCLTLMTDGVLKARDPASGELFGFDRAAAISKESAESVAQAAQAFGQEDDITVLTLPVPPISWHTESGLAIQQGQTLVSTAFASPNTLRRGLCLRLLAASLRMMLS